MICRTKWIPRAGCDLAFVVRGRSLLGQLGAEKMLAVLKLRMLKLNYGKLCRAHRYMHRMRNRLWLDPRRLHGVTLLVSSWIVESSRPRDSIYIHLLFIHRSAMPVTQIMVRRRADYIPSGSSWNIGHKRYSNQYKAGRLKAKV